MNRRHMAAFASGAAILIAALATIAMAPASRTDEPRRMSGLRVEGLAGYEVRDASGANVGQVIHVDTDARGRTRYVRIALTEGGEARVAAFLSFLDTNSQRIDLHSPIDLVLADPSAYSAPAQARDLASLDVAS